VKNPNPGRRNGLITSKSSENGNWHAVCMMNDMAGQGIGQKRQEPIVNIKTTLLSAIGALVLSGLAVGSAIAPAGVAIAAPVKIAQYA
jgi:hypothetical protein